MIKFFQRVPRLWQISKVLAEYRLHELFPKNWISRRWRWLFSLHASLHAVHPQLSRWSRGERLTLALEKLGPIFVKFGQALSTRVDLLPEDIAIPLARLQDRVQPFDSARAAAMIAEALDGEITDLFKSFSMEPLASASIAQVHTAILPDDREVVVKILRPGVAQQIANDLQWMKLLAALVERFYVDGKRLRALEVVAEFESTLEDELDLLREAANASQLRRNFEKSSLMYVPWVYWPYCRHSVLVMERISGIPVSDISALKNRDANLKKLAERGVEIFFTQVFRDCFFHADMHPGNIFINIDKPNDPYYVGVDFGIMGSLEHADQRYLAENFVAFFNRDYRRVAELHVESGWVPRNTPVNQFEAAIRTVCEPIFEKPLAEISCGQLLVRLFQIARRFQMPIQPQLVLLQKTLLQVEGLGRQLYPELDLWSTAKPFLEKWLRQQVGVRAMIRHFRNQRPFWWHDALELPVQMHRTLQSAESHYQQQQLSPQPARKVTSLLSGLLLVSCVMLGFLLGRI